MTMHAGVNGVSREITSFYAGVNGTVHELDSINAGINGVSKEIFTGKKTWARYSLSYIPSSYYAQELQSYGNLYEAWTFENNFSFYHSSSYSISSSGFTLINPYWSHSVPLELSLSTGYFISNTILSQKGSYDEMKASGQMAGYGSGSYLYSYSGVYIGHDNGYADFYGCKCYGVGTSYTSAKGSFIDYVRAEKNTYPANGVTGSYWYILQS